MQTSEEDSSRVAGAVVGTGTAVQSMDDDQLGMVFSEGFALSGHQGVLFHLPKWGRREPRNSSMKQGSSRVAVSFDPLQMDLTLMHIEHH